MCRTKKQTFRVCFWLGIKEKWWWKRPGKVLQSAKRDFTACGLKNHHPNHDQKAKKYNCLREFLSKSAHPIRCNTITTKTLVLGDD